MAKILVLGATGTQGTATIRALLASSQKHSIRALVRNASSDKAKALAAQGVEIVEGGDWDKDVAALEKAVAGMEVLFFISFPSFEDGETEVRGATNIVNAAKKSGTVNHVLYSSVGGIEMYPDIPDMDVVPFFRNYWTSKAKGEELVRNAGFTYTTLLRPTEFMSNWTTLSMATRQFSDLMQEGVWHTAFPSSFVLSLVEPDDIGKVAAAAIDAPATFQGGPHRALQVTSELITAGELVALLGETAGKKLSVATLKEEEYAEAAKKNPIILGQISRLKMKAFKDPKPADDFGLGFGTFREHLAKHKDEVLEVYKNVP